MLFQSSKALGVCEASCKACIRSPPDVHFARAGEALSLIMLMTVQGTTPKYSRASPALNGADVHLGVAHPGVDDVRACHFTSAASGMLLVETYWRMPLSALRHLPSSSLSRPILPITSERSGLDGVFRGLENFFAIAHGVEGAGARRWRNS